MVFFRILLQKDEKLYVIGGWLGAGPLAAFDICVLDMENLEWSQPEYTGESPGACNMHTADYYKGQIYVFRGGNGRDYLNDLHALDIKTFNWRRVNAKGKYPPERANHSSSLIGNRLYIFGGWNGYKRLNDLYMIDLDSEIWIPIEVKGELPSPRAGMSMTNIGDKLLLFGGSGPSSKFFNDIQIYDPYTSEWVVPHELSNKPQPQRAGHTSTLAEGKLFIIGGSCGTDYLTEISVLDICPPPTFISDNYKGTNTLIHGLSEHINCKDFSDVTFMVEGKPFYAHRLVLSVMSEHYRAMFKSGMKESRETVIPVPGVSYKLFTELMTYFYSGTLRLDAPIDTEKRFLYLKDLLKLADQLMLDDIKNQCEIKLAELITPTNSSTLLEISETFNASQLKEYVKWYNKIGHKAVDNPMSPGKM